MGIMTPETCEYLAVRDGCQHVTDKTRWGWNGDKYFASQPGSDGIASIDWTVPLELTESGAAIAGNTFFLFIANSTGVVGDVFKITAKMTTNDGEEKLLLINLTLIDITAD